MCGMISLVSMISFYVLRYVLLFSPFSYAMYVISEILNISLFNLYILKYPIILRGLLYCCSYTALVYFATWMYCSGIKWLLKLRADIAKYISEVQKKP